MEYIKLYKIKNKYPYNQSGSSYHTTKDNKIILDGKFSENKIEFDTPDFSNIQQVEDTNFRFILKIINSSDKNNVPKFYTSETYYTDILHSSYDSNPYFLKQALAPTSIITVDVSNAFNKNAELKRLEQSSSLNMIKNVYMTTHSGSTVVDNISLVKYIDWVVKPASFDESISGGVIAGSELSSYTTSSLTETILKYV